MNQQTTSTKISLTKTELVSLLSMYDVNDYRYQQLKKLLVEFEGKSSATFLIIDGSSMLSTCYYATLPKSIMFAKTQEEKEAHYHAILQNSKGEYTNAMYGMIRSMLDIFKKCKPDYVAVVFDKSRNTFRRTELGADFYKANRSETQYPLREQFIHMEEMLQDIGCICLYGDKYEADDYAASLVKKFKGECSQIYLHTKDHDYFQLVSDNVTMWRPCDKNRLEELNKKYHLLDDKELCNHLPKHVFPFTPEVVYGEAGVHPSEITNQLAILGDTGDNIPGCKGVSSAGTLLVDEYKTIENIYDMIECCNGDKKEEAKLNAFWKENLGITRSPINALKAHKDTVFLSRQLATMKDDIDIDYPIEAFRLRISRSKLMSYLKRYEMKSLYNEI